MNQYTKEENAYIKAAWPDEPIFPILARDPAGAAAIIAWIGESLNTQPPHKLHEALSLAIQFSDPKFRREWPFRKFVNPTVKNTEEPEGCNPLGEPENIIIPEF